GFIGTLHIRRPFETPLEREFSRLRRDSLWPVFGSRRDHDGSRLAAWRPNLTGRTTGSTGVGISSLRRSSAAPSAPHCSCAEISADWATHAPAGVRYWLTFSSPLQCSASQWSSWNGASNAPRFPSSSN